MRRLWDRRAFMNLMVLVKAPFFLSFSPEAFGAHPAAEPAGLTPSQRACVKRVSFLMFPHPEVGDGPYDGVAAAVAELAENRADLATLVARGVEDLDGGKPGAFLALEEAQQVARLREREASPFFSWLYQTTIDRLYNDERVWSRIGYEGSSLERGGYLDRGFDDIDWL